MDISSVSMVMSQASLKQAASLSVLKMAKDQASVGGQALVKMMEQSVQPNLGGNIDIRA